MTNMSALKMMATQLWTELLQGLRQDGLIAACVEQSGPATTKVIVDTCNTLMQAQESATWLRMTMKPTPGREVVACDDNGGFHILTYSEEQGSWMRGKTKVRAAKYAGWRFVNYHAPQVEDVP